MLSTNRLVPYAAALHEALAEHVDLTVVTADLDQGPTVGCRQVIGALARPGPSVVIAGDFGRQAAYGAYLAARRADAFLVCGVKQSRWVVALGARGRVFPFHYPVLDWPAPSETHEAHHPIRVLMLARLVAGKGHDLLVEALARMTGLPWTATMAGAGPEAGRIRALIAQHGLRDRLQLEEGWVDPIQRRALFRTHDVLVLPSRWEAWGLVVAEAQAWGLPVVVGTNIGAAEGALIAGRTGTVVEPLTAGALAHPVRFPDRVQRMSGEAAR